MKNHRLHGLREKKEAMVHLCRAFESDFPQAAIERAGRVKTFKRDPIIAQKIFM
jgi:hypothetical protein